MLCIVIVLLAVSGWTPAGAASLPAKSHAVGVKQPVSKPPPLVSRLALSPAIVEFSFSNRTQASKTVTLINNGPVALPIHVLTRSYTLSPDQTALGPQTVPLLDGSSWVRADQDDFILLAGAVRQVRLQVTVPPHASPGGHYAMVYFEPLTALLSASPQQQSFSSGRVSALLLMAVSGHLRQRADVRGVSVPLIYQPGTLPIDFALENTGNIHLLPHGSVTVRRGGKQVASFALPAGLVLPQTMRHYHLLWEKADIGHYKVQGSFSYGSPAQSLRFSRDVWIVPWLPLLIVVAGGGSTLALILRTHGRWWRAWQALSVSEPPEHR